MSLVALPSIYSNLSGSGTAVDSSVGSNFLSKSTLGNQPILILI